MRPYLAVLLIGLSLVGCVWWVGSSADFERASPIVDPATTEAEESVLLMEPPAAVQREEMQSPDTAGENRALRAQLEAEQARVAQLESERARLEFALGVRPILRHGETERMVALEERLLQGNSPEAASDALTLARWKNAAFEIDALAGTRGIELTQWQREQLIACALAGWQVESQDEAFARIATSRAKGPCPSDFRMEPRRLR